MNGQAIAAQPIAEANLRRLASEQGGPRPRGVREDGRDGAAGETGSVRATRP